MHLNSILSYEEIIPTLNGKHKEIVEIMLKVTRPLRDWDILQKYLEGSNDMNEVRPRITELHQMGVLVEAGNVRGHKGNRSVRTSILNFEVKQQTALF